MNRALPYAALFLALLALGCGGSSVGSSSAHSSSAGASGLTAPQIEAVLMPSAGAVNNNPPVVEDPLNIQTGEVVLFQLAAYDVAGGRHVVTSNNWSWSDTVNQFGTLDSYSGLFTVGQAAMSTQYNVNAYYAGSATPVAAKYLVNPHQARVIGKVVASDTLAGVRGVGIKFYASDNTLSGYAVTSYDGTFRASVNTNAVKFSVDPDTIGPAYWQSYSYGANPAYASDHSQPPLLTFDAGVDTCDSSFQTLYRRDQSQIGTSLTLGENFMFAVTQPSSLLIPVVPASSSDPGIIILNSRVSYPSRPTSTGCSG